MIKPFWLWPSESLLAGFDAAQNDILIFSCRITAVWGLLLAFYLQTSENQFEILFHKARGSEG